MRQTDVALNLHQDRLAAIPAVRYFLRGLPWLIIGIGVLMRLVQYMLNRSLWYDEAALTMNIVERSLSGLLQPLDHGQGAPVGFLLLEKLVTEALGNVEFALRLIPLASGLASLFLFYYFARQYLTPPAVPVALALFAVSHSLIYYSSEVKQYSSDVTITLIIYLAVQRLTSRRLDLKRMTALGIIGAVALWFSHPALFVLAGIGISLLVMSAMDRDWSRAARLAVVCTVWGASLIALYVISLRALAGNSFLQTYWSGAFMPLPPASIADFKWFWDFFIQVFQDPAQISLPDIATAAIFLAGCAALARTRRKVLALLLSPLLLALLASGVHAYPFKGRMLLFSVPVVLGVIAEGADLARRNLVRLLPALGVIGTAVVIAPSLYAAGGQAIAPSTHQDIRPLVSFYVQHRLPNDRLYVFHASEYSVEYYAMRMGVTDINFVRLNAFADPLNRESLLHEVGGLPRKARVWILLSNPWAKRIPDSRPFLHSVSLTATRMRARTTYGAALYLYRKGKPNIANTSAPLKKGQQRKNSGQ